LAEEDKIAIIVSIVERGISGAASAAVEACVRGGAIAGAILLVAIHVAVAVGRAVLGHVANGGRVVHFVSGGTAAARRAIISGVAGADPSLVVAGPKAGTGQIGGWAGGTAEDLIATTRAIQLISGIAGAATQSLVWTETGAITSLVVAGAMRGSRACGFDFAPIWTSLGLIAGAIPK